MSYYSLFTLVPVLLALAVLHLWIRTRYRLALTSVVEKQGGVLSYYHVRVGNIFQLQEFSPESLACLSHFLLLHLIAPLLLSTFLLHTNWNFLIAIGSILASIQLVQRIYPGMESEGESD